VDVFWHTLYVMFLARCMECRRGIAMRNLSVCPSFCLSISVKHVHCYKTEERYVQIFIPYEKSFSLVF